jgi:hypothetical protein
MSQLQNSAESPSVIARLCTPLCVVSGISTSGSRLPGVMAAPPPSAQAEGPREGPRGEGVGLGPRAEELECRVGRDLRCAWSLAMGNTGMPHCR